MNVNPMILELETVTGLPTVPDIYTGTAKKWITFTYEDEKPDLFGDGLTLAETAYIMVNLFNPKDFNYLPVKQQIKDYLESIGIVTSVQSSVYDYNSITIRQTTFEVEITEGR